MIFFEIDYSHFFEVIVLFPLTAMAAAGSTFVSSIPPFKAIGSEFGALVSCLYGCAYFLFLLGEGRYFRCLLFDFVGIFAATRFG